MAPEKKLEKTEFITAIVTNKQKIKKFNTAKESPKQMV